MPTLSQVLRMQYEQDRLSPYPAEPTVYQEQQMQREQLLCEQSWLEGERTAKKIIQVEL